MHAKHRDNPTDAADPRPRRASGGDPERAAVAHLVAETALPMQVADERERGRLEQVDAWRVDRVRAEMRQQIGQYLARVDRFAGEGDHPLGDLFDQGPIEID